MVYSEVCSTSEADISTLELAPVCSWSSFSSPQDSEAHHYRWSVFHEDGSNYDDVTIENPDSSQTRIFVPDAGSYLVGLEEADSLTWSEQSLMPFEVEQVRDNTPPEVELDESFELLMQATQILVVLRMCAPAYVSLQRW